MYWKAITQINKVLLRKNARRVPPALYLGEGGAGGMRGVGEVPCPGPGCGDKVEQGWGVPCPGPGWGDGVGLGGYPVLVLVGGQGGDKLGVPYPGPGCGGRGGGRAGGTLSWSWSGGYPVLVRVPPPLPPPPHVNKVKTLPSLVLRTRPVITFLSTRIIFRECSPDSNVVQSLIILILFHVLLFQSFFFIPRPDVKVIMNSFVDTSPPDLTCPTDMEMNALEGVHYAEVEWEVPVPVDNSGVTVSLSVVPALVPPANLPIGKTRITYTATDGNKNSISCTFRILVQGKNQRPKPGNVCMNRQRSKVCS